MIPCIVTLIPSYSNEMSSPLPKKFLEFKLAIVLRTSIHTSIIRIAFVRCGTRRLLQYIKDDKVRFSLGLVKLNRVVNNIGGQVNIASSAADNRDSDGVGTRNECARGDCIL